MNQNTGLVDCFSVSYSVCKKSNHSERSIAELMWMMLLISVCIVASIPMFSVDIPMWIQPSLVGLLWGGQFMIGFWMGGSNRLGTPRLLASCLGCLWISMSFQSLTDFTFRESLVINTIALTAGWLVIRLDHRAARLHWSDSRCRSRWQFPLIDFFMMATVSACLISGFRSWSAPLSLMLGVGCTLLIGCCGCWAAYHWAWNDRRPVGLPMITAAFLAVASLCGLSNMAPSLSPLELAHWLLSGPAGVLASQICSVIFALALARRFSNSSLPTAEPQTSLLSNSIELS